MLTLAELTRCRSPIIIYSGYAFLTILGPLLMHQAQTNSYPQNRFCETGCTGRQGAALKMRPRTCHGRRCRVKPVGRTMEGGPRHRVGARFYARLLINLRGAGITMKRREFVGGLAVAAGLAGCAKPEGDCSAGTSDGVIRVVVCDILATAVSGPGHGRRKPGGAT